MRKPLAHALNLFLMGFFACVSVTYAVQDPDGRPEQKPPARKPAPKPAPVTKPAPGPVSRPSSRNAAPRERDECEEGELIVRCGLPGCEISVDGNQQGRTDESGDLRFYVARGTRMVGVSKPGYESALKRVTLDCGALETAEVRLKARPVMLRIRTNLPDCELFINDPPLAIGRSNDQGLFSYQATTPALLIEARKLGYLSANQLITITPDSAQKEIALILKPIPALINFSANIEGARVRIDNQGSLASSKEPISLAPGHHQVTIDALGYTPITFDVTLGPGEKINKSVSLQRMPVAQLVALSEALNTERAYESVLVLCQYIFEVEAEHAAAHRLAGLAYLARQDYARAESHLAKALAGNEAVTLPVRRHPREEFDLTKGHDACDAVLVLSKGEVEFRGLRAPGDNFKVAYAQVQIIGIQLKKNTAVYLGSKVTDARGKRQDFNFYSFDKELSQSGRVYLEMLQRLLRAH